MLEHPCVVCVAVCLRRHWSKSPLHHPLKVLDSTPANGFLNVAVAAGRGCVLCTPRSNNKANNSGRPSAEQWPSILQRSGGRHTQAGKLQLTWALLLLGCWQVRRAQQHSHLQWRAAWDVCGVQTGLQ